MSRKRTFNIKPSKDSVEIRTFHSEAKTKPQVTYIRNEDGAAISCFCRDRSKASSFGLWRTRNTQEGYRRFMGLTLEKA
jgi:hypothetical protein